MYLPRPDPPPAGPYPEVALPYTGKYANNLQHWSSDISWALIHNGTSPSGQLASSQGLTKPTRKHTITMSPPPPRSLRRNAFEKLAVLSVQQPTTPAQSSELKRLCQLYFSRSSQSNGLARSTDKNEISSANGPMVCYTPGSYATRDIITVTDQIMQCLRELETIIALSDAAIHVSIPQDAEQLIPRLKQYLLVTPIQSIQESPFLRDFGPSPWELLTLNLTSGLLRSGTKAIYLRDEVVSAIFDFVETCAGLARTSANVGMNGNADENHEVYEKSLPLGVIQVVRLAISLLGFLEAIAKNACFFHTSERIRLITMVNDILSERLMTGFETALSTLRNTKNLAYEVQGWKRWVKHYATTYRPLGAMLLRQTFMAFVCSCASLLVIPESIADGDDVLDILQSKRLLRETKNSPSNIETVETVADIAADGLMAIEAGADYLSLGSAWQHRLAFHVKAYALESFLCCSLLHEDAADPDLLLTWLESTLVDPVQMADEGLATAVLKILAILGQTSQIIASNLCRSLPRYMVQGNFDTRLALTAAHTLSTILRVLPEDTTITTLYSLGNVLSPTSAIDHFGNPTSLNGSVTRASHAMNGVKQQPADSSLSLELNDSDDYSAVYGTVIQTIIGVASKNEDEKMIALAQSMLVQKIGRVNSAVDAKIISEVAALSIYGRSIEFRSLLKLYSRISHDALLQQNQLLLNSVSCVMMGNTV